jgi:hypothetical protein
LRLIWTLQPLFRFVMVAMCARTMFIVLSAQTAPNPTQHDTAQSWSNLGFLGIFFEGKWWA